MQASDVEFEFSQVVQPGQDARLLAVAFHAIRFIDVSGTDLGELAFGSTAANAVQGDGWYGNEQWPDVGSFQWAGGVGRRARMRLAIPPGTEGLLLHVASVTDEQWMTVRVNGTATARVRVDAYWHHSYVPVDAADCPCGPDAEL